MLHLIESGVITKKFAYNLMHVRTTDWEGGLWMFLPSANCDAVVSRMTLASQVVDVYFPKDKYLNRRKNFCFVTFATQQVRVFPPLYLV